MKNNKNISKFMRTTIEKPFEEGACNKCMYCKNTNGDKICTALKWDGKYSTCEKMGACATFEPKQ